jgi:hypothetical protein
MKRKTIFILGFLVILIILAACTAGVNPSVDVPDAEKTVAGFWHGLWHGVIVIITFIISLFSDTVNIYEVHNTGSWYDLGFILGALIALGSGGRASKGKC